MEHRDHGNQNLGEKAILTGLGLKHVHVHEVVVQICVNLAQHHLASRLDQIRVVSSFDRRVGRVAVVFLNVLKLIRHLDHASEWGEGLVGDR